MFASGTNYNTSMNSLVYWSDAIWDEWSPDNLAAFPKCTLREFLLPHSGSTADTVLLLGHTEGNVLGNGAIQRVFGDSLIYGPFWHGYGEGLITQAMFNELTNCNTNIMSTDQASPILMQGAVWTWAVGALPFFTFFFLLLLFLRPPPHNDRGTQQDEQRLRVDRH